MSNPATVIFILLTVIIMVIGGLVTGAMHNLDKLQFNVPWLKWLTLDELVEMGHSRFWARILLPVLHRINQLEVRVLDGLPEKEQRFIKRYGFGPRSVKYHQFRFTIRSRGKREPDKPLVTPYPVPV